MQQGSSVQFTLASATRAGNPQLLSLTATNLPAGATALFSPAQITSGQSLERDRLCQRHPAPLAPISLITIVGASALATTTVNVPINVVAQERRLQRGRRDPVRTDRPHRDAWPPAHCELISKICNLEDL